MPYVTEIAPTRPELSACIHCGLCLPACPTFRLTGKEIASPRGRLAVMMAVLDGVATVDADFDEVMSFCLGCRACEAVCPGLVPYGRALEGARAELAAQRPTAGRRLRGLLLGRALPSTRLMRIVTVALAAAQRWRLARLLPSVARRPLAGIRPLDPGRASWRGRVVEPAAGSGPTVGLVSGCVMDPWFGAVHDAAVGLLTLAGCRVIVPEAQTCCGALAAHDGQAEAAHRLAARNVAAFSRVDLVVADAAGCSAHLKEYGNWSPGGDVLGAKVRDVTELVAQFIADGRLPRVPVDQGRVAVQDACHLRHAQRITAAPRQILRAAGYTPVEIDPDGLCCGAAGVYSLLRPAASAELGRRKAAQVRGSGAKVVATANPGCEMQLRSYLDDGYRIAHPVELLWESLAGPANGYAAGFTEGGL